MSCSSLNGNVTGMFPGPYLIKMESTISMIVSLLSGAIVTSSAQ
jgi:hypothetical protein